MYAYMWNHWSGKDDYIGLDVYVCEGFGKLEQATGNTSSGM